MNNHLLTIEQIANITGFTPKAVRGWCLRGDVFPTARKVPNIPKGQWRILSDDVALLEMLNGHTDNARLLADRNQQIAALKAEIAECQANYDALNVAYHESMAESDALEAEFKTLAEHYNQLMSIYKRDAANHEAQVADLQRYKDHYQQQRRQREQRRAA